MSFNKTSFNGLNAYELNCNPFQAIILPEFGGNLIVFRNVEKGYSFLREPSIKDMGDFKKNPFLYGIPVLFPPNRFEDGTFTFLNHVYQFPLNEPATHNHLHGFFYNRAWEVSDLWTTDTESTVELIKTINEQTDIYTYFPHHFRVYLRYTLSAEGLEQSVRIVNDGEEPMPVMLGFHTTFNAPFTKNSRTEDYTLQLSITNRVELNERSLPTGNVLPLDQNEQLLATEGNSPYFQPLDNHYTAKKDGTNRMVLTDNHEQIKLIYETGSKFPFWMLFNKDAKSGFFCPEPQTIMVNAPNVKLPAEQTGLVELKKGEVWSAHSRFYTEQISCIK